jgi:YD repeat-containing protein
MSIASVAWWRTAVGGTTTFAYDARDRLVEAHVPGGAPESCPADADCDGILDTLDNCPSHANPGQQDSDSAQFNPYDAVIPTREGRG